MRTMGLFGSHGSGAYAQIASWSGSAVASVSVGDSSGGGISIQIVTDQGQVIMQSGPACSSKREAEQRATAIARAYETGLLHSRAEQTRAERHANRGGGGSWINGNFGMND